MRKLLVLSLAAVIVLSMSIAVGAGTGEGWDAPDWEYGVGIFENYNNHSDDDGVVVEWNADGKPRITVTGVNPSSGNVTNTGAQTATATFSTDAYIPCYLRLELFGNGGRFDIESFGPGADAVGTPQSAYVMRFHSNMGGYIDDDWESVGHGFNVQIAPPNLDEGDAPLFLQACDMWTAYVWSNDFYGLQVSATPLTHTDSRVTSDMNSQISIEMRTNMENNWSDGVTLSEQPSVVYTDMEPTTGTTTYHQFRVPYNADIIAGQYQGTITFKAFTI